MVVYGDYSSRGQCLMSWVLSCDPDKMTVNEQIRGPLGLVLQAAHGMKITEADGIRRTEKQSLRCEVRTTEGFLLRKRRCLIYS